MATPIEIYCDFDGTITKGDTIDVLLEMLADPQWREVEARWEKGEIGSRQCMTEQVPLIRGGWQAIQKVLDTVEIDPTFPSFVTWCRSHGIPIRVVSDGIDKVIHYIFKRHQVRVDQVWANRLVEDQAGNLSLLFPHAVSENVCGSGVCKCKIIDSFRSNPTRIVIGDGRTDFCWAAVADVVFAKDKLHEYCLQSKIPCLAYDNFSFIKSTIEEQFGLAAIPISSLIPALSNIS